jgi:hypothetical protein
MDSAAGATMARVKGKNSDRDDVAVKIARTIVGKARMVATHKGVSVAELLSDMLRDPMDKAYAKMLRELEREEPEGKGSK